MDRNPELAMFSDIELRMAFRMPWSTNARETLRQELIARDALPCERTGERREQQA
jgi:hypothetical protein